MDGMDTQAGYILETEDYYEILGIDPKSTVEEIRDAYRSLSRVYHPDKSRRDTTALFAKCAQAYDILQDPTTRALYDIVNGYIEDTVEARRKYNRLKRKDAEEQTKLMEIKVENIRKFQQRKKGLLIVDAQYGSLSGQHPGKFIDVTTPLQCMVDANSSLVIPHGSSKAWLDGFYCPCEDEECFLMVKYKFLNKMHFVCVGDNEGLQIPMKEHLGMEGMFEQPGQPQESFELRFQKEMVETRRTKRRRRAILYTVLAVLGVTGYCLYTKKNPFTWVKNWYLGTDDDGNDASSSAAAACDSAGSSVITNASSSSSSSSSSLVASEVISTAISNAPQLTAAQYIEAVKVQ